jgi:hypothetical protein
MLKSKAIGCELSSHRKQDKRTGERARTARSVPSKQCAGVGLCAAHRQMRIDDMARLQRAKRQLEALKRD